MSTHDIGNDIGIETFDAWLRDGRELGVLDVRRPEAYGYGGPLYGANLPPQDVEARAAELLPRAQARVVVVDEDGRTAGEVAAVLRARGHGQAHALAGGLARWASAGLGTPFLLPISPYTRRLLAEEALPRVDAETLQRLRARGEAVAVLDIRTPGEFEAGHVPGAVHVPGADLLLRFHALVPDARTLVLTSCAGLTRAILAAQTLRDAGVPHRVGVLDEGTGGWRKTGQPLAQGAAPADEPAGEVPAAARQAVERLAERTPVPAVGAGRLQAWREDPRRSTYVLDLRPAAARQAHPVPAAVPVIGGQLSSSPQRHVAVRGARLVLVDDEAGARAAVTGHWLRLRGWDVWSHRPQQRG